MMANITRPPRLSTCLLLARAPVYAHARPSTRPLARQPDCSPARPPSLRRTHSFTEDLPPMCYSNLLSKDECLLSAMYCVAEMQAAPVRG